MLWPCSITLIHIIHVFKDIKLIYFFMNINESRNRREIMKKLVYLQNDFYLIISVIFIFFVYRI